MGASAVLRLQKVGFTVEQVEALADFMETQAAGKADLTEAKSELKADRRGPDRHGGGRTSAGKADHRDEG